MSTQDNARHQTALRVTTLGLIIDLVLTGAKLVAGLIVHSNALVADAIHSLSDAATDLMVMIVSHFSNHGPDQDHPYGHGRYETVGTIALGTVLGAVALGIGYEALKSLLHPTLIKATPMAFGVAIGSVILKEWQYRFTIRVAESIDSNLIKANAWHSRADALSSLVVVAGLAGVALGFTWFDSIAAFVIAVIILRVAVVMVWDSLKELVDTMPISPEEAKSLLNDIKSLDGVIDAHCLRSRQMGPHQTVDVHVQVSPRVSVSEGHYISDTVIDMVRRQHPTIIDLVVHIDAEDDDERGAMQRNLTLPNRASVSEWLHTKTNEYPWINDISNVTLHYLHGKVHADCILAEQSCPANLEALQQAWSAEFGGQLNLLTRYQ